VQIELGMVQVFSFKQLLVYYFPSPLNALALVVTTCMFCAERYIYQLFMGGDCDLHSAAGLWNTWTQEY
jgi:hypothetical protein